MLDIYQQVMNFDYSSNLYYIIRLNLPMLISTCVIIIFILPYLTLYNLNILTYIINICKSHKMLSKIEIIRHLCLQINPFILLFHLISLNPLHQN